MITTEMTAYALIGLKRRGYTALWGGTWGSIRMNEEAEGEAREGDMDKSCGFYGFYR